MAAAAIRVVAILKFVAQDPVVLVLIDLVRLLELLARCALQVLLVGAVGALSHVLGFLRAAHRGDILSDRHVLQKILVFLSHLLLLVSPLRGGASIRRLP